MEFPDTISAVEHFIFLKRRRKMSEQQQAANLWNKLTQLNQNPVEWFFAT